MSERRRVATKLKLAIIGAGYSQRSIAHKCGIHETTLSQIVNGRLNPTQREKSTIATAINKPITELSEQ